MLIATFWGTVMFVLTAPLGHDAQEAFIWLARGANAATIVVMNGAAGGEGRRGAEEGNHSARAKGAQQRNGAATCRGLVLPQPPLRIRHKYHEGTPRPRPAPALAVMTPEHYPTSFRSFAVGLIESISRLGGFITPYIVNAFHDAVRRQGRAWQGMGHCSSQRMERHTLQAGSMDTTQGLGKTCS